jgi:hypothetical protein
MDLQERVTFDRRAGGERKAENLGIGECDPQTPPLRTTIHVHAARAGRPPLRLTGRKPDETLYLFQR